MPVLDLSTSGRRTDPPNTREFDADAFLASPGPPEAVAVYRAGETIYSQGGPSDAVLYIQQGSVKLSVLSPAGREAVVGVLNGGEFLGEEALTGQPARRSSATAMNACRIRIVPKGQMIHLLHQQQGLSDRFIAHVLARNRHLEEDLVDQLFNACEKRLARTLLLLARYGTRDEPRGALPGICHEVLAEMVGTTRSRVNVLMNKFRKLGFIEYNNDSLTVHHTLLTVVLRDDSPEPEGHAIKRAPRAAIGVTSPVESGRPSPRASASQVLR